MKYIQCLLLLLAFPIIIHGQEFDEKYLESLPEDIKAKILNQSFEVSESQKPTYRQSQLSSNLKKKKNDSDLFGSDFFNSLQTSFMPINEPNLNPSYVLDYDDVIDIQLIGQKNSIESYSIKRDGSINIPEIGKLNIGGLTIEKASSLINANVQSSYIGTTAYVTLTNLRDVNVLVSGNAENPGIYTLNGNSNILHALIMAGGVSEHGSYREINLIRNNNVIETLDVYNLILNGNYNLTKQLRTGDVIHVEPAKKIATISGAVKRPGTFELKNNQKLYSLIDYSYGLSRSADLKNIYLQRVLDGELKSLPIVNISQFKNIDVNDGDKIYVRKVPYKTAFISGAIMKPGSYLMSENETIDDLIKKAGGYTNNAYTFGAIYENMDALEKNKKAREVLYKEFIDNLTLISQQNVGSTTDFSSLITLFQQVQSSAPNGRISINLSSDNTNTIQIKDGDKLYIPETAKHVFIYGEVSVEGAILHKNGKSVDYYLDKSGGLKKYAEIEEIYVLHPNGETQRFSKKRNIFVNQPQDINIYPGSIVYVPKRVDDSASRRLVTQAYVSILGNIGIALASLSSINNTN